MTEALPSIATLFVIATPIGQLDDLSLRARATLERVSVIAAEDTRRAKRLLIELEIDIKSKRIISYFDAVEQSRSEQIIKLMMNDSVDTALICDGGTPCISDPGFRLVRSARQHGLKVCGIPGPSALVTMISIAGLPSDRVLFLGFLPTKSNALHQEIVKWAGTQASVVFYESAHRIVKTLEQIAVIYPEAQIAIGRELTKTYEESKSGSVDTILKWCQLHQTLRGELTVMCDPGIPPAEPFDWQNWQQDVRNQFAQGWTSKDLCLFYRDLPLKKSDLYRQIQSLKDQMRENPTE